MYRYTRLPPSPCDVDMRPFNVMSYTCALLITTCSRTYYYFDCDILHTGGSQTIRVHYNIMQCAAQQRLWGFDVCVRALCIKINARRRTHRDGVDDDDDYHCTPSIGRDRYARIIIILYASAYGRYVITIILLSLNCALFTRPACLPDTLYYYYYRRRRVIGTYIIIYYLVVSTTRATTTS